MDINDVENLHRQELIELVKRLLERIKGLEAYVMEQDAEIQQLRGQLGQKKPPWVKRNRPKSEGHSTITAAIERSQSEQSSTLWSDVLIVVTVCRERASTTLDR